MKKVLFIASGGGHLEELLALKPLFNECEYLLVSEKTPTTLYLKQRFKNVKYLKYGTIDHPLPYLFIFPFNIIKSLFIFLKFKPDAIVTTGTHTAVPMCMIGHFFKKKVVFIETLANITTGTKAGRLVYKYVDKFIIQWPQLKDVYPDSEYWGCIF